MSEMVKQQVSVLIGVVPLFAVNRISLSEQYALPQVGDKGFSLGVRLAADRRAR